MHHRGIDGNASPFYNEVVKLDGADGKTLFDASGLSSYESNRLKELKQQYQTQ